MGIKNHYLLDDMEKYFNDFKREDYESKSEEELIRICRPYYREHLPVDVTAWLRVNEPDEKLLYKKGCVDQVVFIRDKILRNLFFYKEYPETKNNFDDDACNKCDMFQPLVISEHRSKSVLLPVMEINLKSVGVHIVFIDNFYNWHVTIESENDIDCDFKGTFTDESYHYCFCEGFPKDRIYGMYKDNHKKFTCCINNDYELFTFMWLLREYLYR